MDRYIYAVLTDGIVTGISNLNGEVTQEDMILITSYDETLMGKKYVDGTFIDNPTPPQPSFFEMKMQYVSLIRDAKDLGEDAEVYRLQLEWYDLKVANGWLQEGELPPTPPSNLEEVVDTMLGGE